MKLTFEQLKAALPDIESVYPSPEIVVAVSGLLVPVVAAELRPMEGPYKIVLTPQHPLALLTDTEHSA